MLLLPIAYLLGHILVIFIGFRLYLWQRKRTGDVVNFENRMWVVAAAIFEPDWRSGKAVPTRITKTDDSPLGIAGLWSSWKSDKGELVYSFTMLADALPERSRSEPTQKPPPMKTGW